MDLPPTLTVNQVARLLQVKPRTIRRGIELGDIPAKKIGRVWRIPRTFVSPYLNPGADQDEATTTRHSSSTTD